MTKLVFTYCIYDTQIYKTDCFFTLANFCGAAHHLVIYYVVSRENDGRIILLRLNLSSHGLLIILLIQMLHAIEFILFGC